MGVSSEGVLMLTDWYHFLQMGYQRSLIEHVSVTGH